MKTLPGMECAHSALGPKLRGLASGRLVRKVYMRTKRNVMGNLDLLELEFRARYYAANCCIINGSAIRASGMRKNDINLADLTPAGCLLVLVTVALVLVSVVWTVSMLPEEWARFIPKHATAIPVALLGMLFFWVCARILGPLGFRIRRSRGEPKIVAISFGFLLLLIGITSLLLPVILLAGFRTDLPVGTPVLLGFGGFVFLVLGAMLIRRAIITQRDERRTDTQVANDPEGEYEASWHHPISGAGSSQDGKS